MRRGRFVQLLDREIGAPGFVHRLGGDGVRLRHLAVDLVHGRRQLVGGGGDVAHIRGGLRRSGCGAGGLGGGFIGGAGELGRGRQHLIGNTPEFGEGCFHFRREARDLVRHMLLALRAQFGIGAHGAIELFVAAHGALEHTDRARQRADLVAAFAERYRHRSIAGGDRFGDMRDFRDRIGNAARNHPCASSRQHDREAGEQAKPQGGLVDAGVDFRVEANCARRINLGEIFQILVERLAHRAVGVVVAPFAAGGGTDFGAQPRQFAAEIDELRDAAGELSKQFGVVATHRLLPVVDHLGDLLVEFENAVGVNLRRLHIRRHVDAARFHHHGVNQSVHLLDVQSAGIGGFEFVGQRRMVARRRHRDHRQRDGRGGH